jgi:hypothetical protein
MGVKGLLPFLRDRAATAAPSMFRKFDSPVDAVRAATRSDGAARSLVIVDAKGYFYPTFIQVCKQHADWGPVRAARRGASGGTQAEAQARVDRAFFDAVRASEARLMADMAAVADVVFVWDHPTFRSIAKADEDDRRTAAKRTARAHYDLNTLRLTAGGRQSQKRQPAAPPGGNGRRRPRKHKRRNRGIGKRKLRIAREMMAYAWSQVEFPCVSAESYNPDVHAERASEGERPGLDDDCNEDAWLDANPNIAAAIRVISADEADNTICRLSRVANCSVAVLSRDSDFIVREPASRQRWCLSSGRGDDETRWTLTDKARLSDLFDPALTTHGRLQMVCLASGHDYTGKGLRGVGMATAVKGEVIQVSAPKARASRTR